MNFLFGCRIKIGKLQMLIGSFVRRVGLRCSGLIRHRKDLLVSFPTLVQQHNSDTRSGVSDKSLKPGRTLVDKQKRGPNTTQSMVKQVQLDWSVGWLTIRVSNTQALTQGNAGEQSSFSADAIDDR